MKRFLLYIISLILAGYFFIAGDGFNVVDFCCDGCRNAGIDEVINSCIVENENHEDACCKIHNDKNEEDESLHHFHAEKCSFYHFSIETPTITTHHLKIFPENIQLFVINFQIQNILISDISTTSIMANKPPELTLTTGRSILSHKSVLLI